MREISIERAVRITMAFRMDSYPWPEGTKLERQNALFNGPRGKPVQDWGDGQSWLCDIFASVCSRYAVSEHEYEELKRRIFTVKA